MLLSILETIFQIVPIYVNVSISEIADFGFSTAIMLNQITNIYYSLLKSHLTVQICTVNYVQHFVNSKEIIFGGALRTKCGDSKYCNLTVNSVMHIFLQNFQNHIQEHILSMSKSEHMFI